MRQGFRDRQTDLRPSIVYDEKSGTVELPAEFAGVHYTLVDTLEKQEAFRKRMNAPARG